MSSRAVSIAELKNNLSAYLARVRGGEELLVRDRQTPIARIVPLGHLDPEEEETALAAEGKVRLPNRALPAAYWRKAGPKISTDRCLELLDEDRGSR